MPPGRKCQPAVEKMTAYEKEKVATMMKNNQRLQSLGIPALSLLVAKSRGRASDRSKLTESGRNKENVQDIIDKHTPAALVSENEQDNELTASISIMPAGSKRVMALEGNDPPARMTRQRTKEQDAAKEALQVTTTNTQEDALMAVDSHTGLDDQIEIVSEEESNAMARRLRGRTMGKELERISRGLCSRIQVHVAEGKRRPDAPIQAAKLASECGIIVRNHIPILPRWKDYKEEAAKPYVDDYMRKIAAQFAIDIEDKAVKNACMDLLKCATRQLRHQLKKNFFDGVPADKVPITSPVSTMSDAQWRALVELWSSAKHKEKCMANKSNREKVRFHQRTGSRSYVVHVNLLRQDDKYKDVEPNAIEFFKECHTSTKSGVTEVVKDALAQMEAIVDESAQEGQVSKTPAEAVLQVLPSKKFLQNIGLDAALPKRSAKTVADARVPELEAQLEAEKKNTTELREKFEAMEADMNRMKKQSEATNAALRRLFGIDND